MLNVIFTGEFTYPEGLAGTRRVQHFIDYLSEKNSVKVCLIRQTFTDYPSYLTSGNYKGNDYFIVGSGLSMSLRLLYQIPVCIYAVIKKMIQWKKKHSRNILYIYHGISLENFLLVIFSKLIGYKIIVDYVEDLNLDPGSVPKIVRFKNRTIVFFEWFLPLLADGLIVISTYLQTKYSKYKKLPLIHIPISASIGNETYNALFSKLPVKIAYSGTYGKKDGIDTLVMAFKKFLNYYPDSLLLLSGYNKFKELIEQYLIDERIQYVGFLPEDKFQRFLCSADILCITRNDSAYAAAGFPYKLGEYLATGKPVITTCVGDVYLYLDNYKDALIVDPENPEQICSAIIYLVENPEKAFEIGHNGQKKCMKYFDPVTNGEKLLNFLITIE